MIPKLITGFILCCCIATFAFDGFTIGVGRRHASKNEKILVPENYVAGDRGTKYLGKVIKYTIEDSKPIRTDTLTDYICRRAAINIWGTKIAFIRYNCKLVKGNVLEGPNTPCYISVMDSDGSNMVDLAEIQNPGAGENGHLDWAGDWVYYEQYDTTQPDQANGTGEIWKVRYDNPSTNQKVGKAVHELNHMIWRWTISQDAQYQAVNHRGRGNFASCFPPPDGNYLNCAVENANKEGDVNITGCNIVLSPTASFIYHYRGANHNMVWIERWDKKTMTYSRHDIGTTSGGISNLMDLMPWVKEQQGIEPIVLEGKAGGEFIKPATNSDRWVLQQLGIWQTKGGMESGTNQFLANWVTKEGIMVSNNQRIGSGKWLEEGLVYHGTSGGDFWVKPPAGKEGMIETAEGDWITVDEIGEVASHVNTNRVRKNKSIAKSLLRTSVSFDKKDGTYSSGIYIQQHGDKKTSAFDIQGKALRKRIIESE